jgi:hypothetical protein
LTEIALPHAAHFRVLDCLGFAERGLAFLLGFAGLGAAFLFGFAGLERAFDLLFGFAELGAANGDVFGNPFGWRRLLDLTDLMGEWLCFGRPRSSQQSLTSLAVGWVRPQ